MKGMWLGSLGVSLGVLIGTAQAQDYQWRPARSPAAMDSGPATVILGRPVALNDGGAAAAAVVPVAGDRPMLPATYGPAATLAAPRPVVVRAQAPDPAAPGGAAPPPPPPVPPSGPFPGMPTTPAEQFNCGVVTDPPAGSHPFLKGCQDFLGGCKNVLADVGSTEGGRTAFQSDHGFDVFSSPVTNPFLFEDPRALTELRPIFMYQKTPGSTPVFRGGDIEYLGLQGRLALTQRLSLVVSEFGVLWIEPHAGGGDFSSHSGFAEVRLGPKYTFYRCEETGCVAAAGLTFDIPVGDRKVLQDTGTLSLEPYVSVGKNFWKTNYGSFNFLGTIGYSAGTDNQRTDYLFTSMHLDFDVACLHKIYPFVELNWFAYTQSGKARALGVEGRDLFNFGSSGVGRHDAISMATGLRFKFSERWQTGFGVEFPVNDKELLDWRITADVIFRF
jgi:hypothetical protein